MGLIMWLMMRVRADQSLPSQDSGPFPQDFTSEPVAAGTSSDERLTQLRAELQVVMAQQAAIAAQIDSLAAAEYADTQQSDTPSLAPSTISHQR